MTTNCAHSTTSILSLKDSPLSQQVDKAKITQRYPPTLPPYLIFEVDESVELHRGTTRPLGIVMFLVHQVALLIYLSMFIHIYPTPLN